jgi:osmotically-inducible protein OsmY
MSIGRNCKAKRRRISVALTATLLSLGAVLGCSGCGTARPLSARRDTRDTAEIQKALQMKLAGDARFSRVTNVKVDPANGVVTLSGRVASESEREDVGKLASSVKGVAMIYNEIQPEKPGP